MTQALTSEDAFQMRKSPVIAILVYTTLLPMVQSQSCSCGCCVSGYWYGCNFCCWPCLSSPPPPPPSGGSSSGCGAGCTNGVFYGCYCSSSSSGSSSSRFVVHLSHLSYLCGVAVRQKIYFWICGCCCSSSSRSSRSFSMMASLWMSHPRDCTPV